MAGRLHFALRVDKAIEEVTAHLNSKGVGGFGVRETVNGANEHWQFFIETDVRKIKNLQAFRVALCRAVPVLKGNGAYSVTEVKDVSKYVRYLCKGASEGEGVDLAWRNSILYDDSELEMMHTEYWKENKKLKKRKAGSVMDFVIDECKRENIEWKDREKIAKIYVGEIAKRVKPFNQFAAKAAVNGIQMALCPDDSAVNMFAELL